MKSPARLLGQVTQGIVIGCALVVAIRMIAISEFGAKVFQYQGF